MASSGALSGAASGAAAGSAGGPWGALIGGGLGLLGGILGSNASKKAAKAAAEAAAFHPFNVQNPLGSATFKNGTASFAPSDQAQGLLDQFANTAGSFNPNGAPQLNLNPVAYNQPNQFSFNSPFNVGAFSNPTTSISPTIGAGNFFNPVGTTLNPVNVNQNYDPLQVATDQFNSLENVLAGPRSQDLQALRGSLMAQGRSGLNASGLGSPELTSYFNAVEQQRANNLNSAFTSANNIGLAQRAQNIGLNNTAFGQALSSQAQQFNQNSQNNQLAFNQGLAANDQLFNQGLAGTQFNAGLQNQLFSQGLGTNQQNAALSDQALRQFLGLSQNELANQSALFNSNLAGQSTFSDLSSQNLNNYLNLIQSGNSALNLGGVFGGRGSAAGANQAAYLQGAGNTQASLLSGAFGGLGDAVSKVDFGSLFGSGGAASPDYSLSGASSSGLSAFSSPTSAPIFSAGNS